MNQQQKKNILKFFNISLKEYEEKFNSMTEDDKMNVEMFLAASQHSSRQQEQITKQMLEHEFKNKPLENSVQILTKKIHVLIKKPSKLKRSKNYILQQVMVNPLFQKQGIFKRFLETFRKSIPNDSKIIIESVIGDNLLKYIEKYPQHFRLIPGMDNTFQYISNQEL